jgi:N-methylhydantoinase A/oxoprolinase/acetone carboxylase beta subunit
MADTKSFLIGIDTGGTYTDAVVINAANHSVISAAKALTTKGDLSIGVIEAMRAAIGKAGSIFSANEVGIVAVSTTLATNAIVEGHGSSVAAILCGFDDGMAERTGIAKAFANMPILRASGGHDHNGNEASALDEKAVQAFVEAEGPDVSAFAVASTFAVRNSAHEIRLRDLITKISGRPVTLSSDLASALDAPRRALTAVLNARLVSRIGQLVDAVRLAMTEIKIVCPLMIVKGDGTLALAEAVQAKPIETVLSGPAASLVGAQWLSGLDNLIMSDMGGTTTDVGLLIDGRPQVAEQGAEVGGWRTMVKAIDVKTIGLGGDSEIHAGVDGKITIGPQRAVPISLLGQRYPEIMMALLDADLAATEGGSLLGKFVLLPFGATSTGARGLSDREAEVLAQVTENPQALQRVASSAPALRAVAALRKRGLIQYAAFTPSDASHVLGLQNNWNAHAAQLAVKLFLRFMEMKLPDDNRLKVFCQAVHSQTVSQSARVILNAAFGQAFATGAIADAICDGRGEINQVKISLTPKIPVVAVGGPVKIYYPELGRRLGCEVLFPAHCDVANAVGAAASLVAQRVTVSVEGDGNGAFRVLGAGQAEQFAAGGKALEEAILRAETQALNMARESGAKNPVVTTKVQKSYLPDASSDDGLLTATITAEARGRP